MVVDGMDTLVTEEKLGKGDRIDDEDTDCDDTDCDDDGTGNGADATG